MRQNILKFTIIFLFISLNIFGQTGEIQGVVYDRIQKERLAYAMVTLLNTDKITFTDIKGCFKIDSIPDGIYNLSVSFVGAGDTILTNLKITSQTKLKLKLKLPPTCKYDNHRNNNNCPICGKKDKVIPIIYGLPVGKLDEERYFYAGCQITICDPKWYCKRDKHKF